MAEVLGVTSSIIAIFDLSTKVLAFALNTTGRLHAEDDIARLKK